MQDVARYRVDDPDLFVALGKGGHKASVVFGEAESHHIGGEVSDEPCWFAFVDAEAVAGDGIVVVFVTAIGDIDARAVGGELEVGDRIVEGLMEQFVA